MNVAHCKQDGIRLISAHRTVTSQHDEHAVLLVQVTEVKALIGFFDLDPNRVYDVVLEAFESAPGNAALLALAPLFSAEARTQILGFKFQRLAADGVPAPEALFNIAAQLIKVGMHSSSKHFLEVYACPVSIQGVLPWRAPTDGDLSYFTRVQCPILL